MKILFTKLGFEEVCRQRDQLVSDRPAAVLDLKKAREMGDLSENGYYKSAKIKLSDIDRNIRQLSHIIKSAQVVTVGDKKQISIGSKVELELGEKIKKYEIVGEYEANPSEGKISYMSPIGRVLLGKKVGDKVEVQTPSGASSYIVKKIN